MNKPTRITALLTGSLLMLLSSAVLTRATYAQDERGFLLFHVDLGGSFEQPPIVMISAIYDGEIVTQTEFRADYPETQLIVQQPGLYETRVEGDGVVTEVKRGIHVFPGKTTNLSVVLQPGEGIHVVEYATGGLAREEVAVRLRLLEADYAELKKGMAALQDKHAEQ